MPSPFDNYGLLELMYDASPVTTVTNAGSVIDHGGFPDDFAEALYKAYPDLAKDKRVDRNLADIAINFAGGYDWGVRDNIDPESARDMGKAFQFMDYMKGVGSPARQADAEQDYLENLAGVNAGIQHRGERLSMDDLVKAAYSYADVKKRGLLDGL